MLINLEKEGEKMRFTFEEVELINNCFVNVQDFNTTKKEYIKRLVEIKNNTIDGDLIKIVDNVVKKVSNIDEITFNKMINNLPVNIFEEYV